MWYAISFQYKKKRSLIFAFKAELFCMYHNEKLRRDKGREKLRDIISNWKKKTCEFQCFPSVVIEYIHKMLSNFNLKESAGPCLG